MATGTFLNPTLWGHDALRDVPIPVSCDGCGLPALAPGATREQRRTKIKTVGEQTRSRQGFFHSRRPSSCWRRMGGVPGADARLKSERPTLPKLRPQLWDAFRDLQPRASTSLYIHALPVPCSDRSVAPVILRKVSKNRRLTGSAWSRWTFQ